MKCCDDLAPSPPPHSMMYYVEEEDGAYGAPLIVSIVKCRGETREGYLPAEAGFICECDTRDIAYRVCAMFNEAYYT